MLKARCKYCDYTTSHKPNDIAWARKNKYCKKCNRTNCSAFLDRCVAFDTYEYSWRSFWIIERYKFNWLRLKWEKEE